ncbi:WD40/YVTN/BNR-like repeat-containing protein [Leptonema illini]|uniref:Lipoprotein n=1 Tax=Leptonema illini DSM 21528 TaxID=929563 RepID=H2CIK4_9LEPT|nr:hypothetical protein [Leptonema illini]EHQ05997.1 hypothetical protein Lepil_1306 [Leptonema illini DSM 21528]
MNLKSTLRLLILGLHLPVLLGCPGGKDEESDLLSTWGLLGFLSDTAPLKPLELEYPEAMRSEAEVAFYLSSRAGLSADRAGFKLYNAVYYSSSASATVEKRSDIRSLVMRELTEELNRLRSDIVNRADQGSAYFTFNLTPDGNCPHMTGTLTGTTRYEIGSDYATVWIDVNDMNLQLEFTECVDGTVSFKDRAALGINSNVWPYNNDYDRDVTDGTIIIEHGEFHLEDHITAVTISGESSASLPMRTDAEFLLNGKAFSLNGREEYRSLYSVHALDWNGNRLRGYDTFTGTVNGQPMTLTLPYDYNPLNERTYSTGRASKITFKKAVSGTSSTLNSVRFLKGKFWATGDNCTLLTSVDGKNWSPVSLGAGCNEDLSDIATDGAKLIIVTKYKNAYKSDNGITWTKQQLNSLYARYFGIKYLNDLWVAYGGVMDDPTIAVSDDGSTWLLVTPTDVPGASVTDTLNDAYFDGTGISIVGDNGWLGRCAANCTVGTNWTFTKKDKNKPYTGIFKRNGIFYLMADTTSAYDSTSDWSSVEEVTGSKSGFTNRVYDDGYEVHASSFNKVRSSQDGLHWRTTALYEDFGPSVYGFDCSTAICAAVGSNGTVYYKELQ